MSFSHLLILAIIAIIVVPPEKLPEVAKQAARFLRDMRRMTSGIFDDLKQDVILKPDDLLKQKQIKPTIHTPSEMPDQTKPLETATNTPAPLQTSDAEYAEQIKVAENNTEKKPHE